MKLPRTSRLFNLFNGRICRYPITNVISQRDNGSDCRYLPHYASKSQRIPLITAIIAAISMGTTGKGDITAIFAAISEFDIPYSMITQTNFV
jgi:hypothetical protein